MLKLKFIDIEKAINYVYREAQGDDNNRPYHVLKILKQNIDWADSDKNKFIDLFWESTNYPSHHAKVWREIFSHYPKVKEAKLLHKTMEPVTIYRGASENGFSWTTNLKKAVWFCNRNRQMGDIRSVVFGSVVKPHGILFMTNERLEDEVVIRFWRKDIWKMEPQDITDLISQ